MSNRFKIPLATLALPVVLAASIVSGCGTKTNAEVLTLCLPSFDNVGSNDDPGGGLILKVTDSISACGEAWSRGLVGKTTRTTDPKQIIIVPELLACQKKSSDIVIVAPANHSACTTFGLNPYK